LKHLNRPVVDLGDYPDPIIGYEFILDAGTGDLTPIYGRIILTTTQTFTAREEGQYYVTVTDNQYRLYWVRHNLPVIRLHRFCSVKYKWNRFFSLSGRRKRNFGACF
jgi:hypothetical protein